MTDRQRATGARVTSLTVSDRAADSLQRRAEAHRRGLYPVPLTEGRSRNMQAIRRTDTSPEVMLRRELHRQGYRFRKDLRIKVGDVWVRPDIAFTKRKVAIFVDGCFWHGCPDHGRAPTHNASYWSPKLTRNRERDAEQTATLEDAGWKVLRYWEHEDVGAVVEAITAMLRRKDEVPSRRIRPTNQTTFERPTWQTTR